jgi:hypothetical protein
MSPLHDAADDNQGISNTLLLRNPHQLIGTPVQPSTLPLSQDDGMSPSQFQNQPTRRLADEKEQQVGQQANQLIGVAEKQGDQLIGSTDQLMDQLINEQQQQSPDFMGQKRPVNQLIQTSTRLGDQLSNLRRSGTRGRWRTPEASNSGGGGDLFSAGLGFYSLGARPQDALDALQVTV